MSAAAAVFLRVLLATAQFLAEIPTNEQGYSYDTVSLSSLDFGAYPLFQPGGTGWTWKNKQREVNCCVEALYQLVNHANLRFYRH